MSELSLIPNPQLMLVQAVVFMSQIYVVNRFLVVPFSKLKGLRETATVGADTKVEELKNEIRALTQQIETRLSETSEQIKSSKESVRMEAKKKREQYLIQAQKDVVEMANSTRQEVLLNLQEEIKKIDTLASKYADALYTKISG